MKSGLLGIITGALLLFATMPSSAYYGLHNYGFGSGGTATANYGLNATTGEVSDT